MTQESTHVSLHSLTDFGKQYVHETNMLIETQTLASSPTGPSICSIRSPLDGRCFINSCMMAFVLTVE